MLELPRNELCASNSFRFRCDSGQIWDESGKCVQFVVGVVGRIKIQNKHLLKQTVNRIECNKNVDDDDFKVHTSNQD